MIARLLSGSAFLWATLLVFALLGFFVMSVDQREVDRVTVVGHLTDSQLVDVKNVLEQMDARSSDTEEIQQVVTDLEWVHHANVRKVWPGGVSVEVVPEHAIAYWNDDAFINAEGKVLVTDLLLAGDLPHLFGPVGAEVEVMSRYQQMSRLLMNHGHEIQALRFTDRGAWSLETRGSIEVLLGKEDLRARLDRFLLVSQRLEDSGQVDAVSRMDARYVNGVAVHFNKSQKNALPKNTLEVAEINKNVGERSL